MAARKRTPGARIRNAGSWMAILAATTLGVETAAATVHAEVRVVDEEVRRLRSDREYRLIVQTYDRDPSSPSAKPIGSLQRAVTAAEMREGVRIDLVELRAAEAEASGVDAEKTVMVAWLETGRPNLEFDARMARPPLEGLLGRVRLRASELDDRAVVTLRSETADAPAGRPIRVTL